MKTYNTVNTTLPLDEQDEYEQIITLGDSILNQFYYGNYTDSIDVMVKEWIRPSQLAEYLEDKALEYDMDVSGLYDGHFTYSLFAYIGESYEVAHTKAIKEK